MLVPPMSKPMARWKPAAWATCEKPITPPAGPERMLSLPTNESASTSPPAEVRICNRPAPQRLAQPVDVRPQDRVQIGVDDRGVAAGDNFHQRRDAAGEADFGKAQLRGDAADQLFVIADGR